MRFIIMHKTNAHWESGAIPSPELIARVGALLGELAKAGVLVVSAASLEDAGRWAVQYVYAVEADEVDLRELE
jgi:hypothetical protein